MRSAAVALLALLAPTLNACDDMANQPKRLPFETKSPQEPPAGTVARDEVAVPLPPVTLALLQRGRERFDAFCSPCHGRTGDGHGIVVERGFPAPPSYHIDRLRQAPVQHFYDVISNGYGAMFSYSARVPPADRWAIIAYIRALQAADDTSIADLPPDQKKALP